MKVVARVQYQVPDDAEFRVYSHTGELLKTGADLEEVLHSAEASTPKTYGSLVGVQVIEDAKPSLFARISGPGRRQRTRSLAKYTADVQLLS
ncbi:hypothetical protein I6N91_15115 [Arthrobacter sp. MSA 4-2]|uniref:hypothetical protein n=1 Tax=Arthrobacter sp. MSA 4-2 TaxID=2794349 RepID=UPI0018E7E931|nr:hypothetical protein [Arthrobacter sp. MSA 4-2]MBJ2122312.1 hypothetical protein [Arthrobacter sp. MSA 4-2]